MSKRKSFVEDAQNEIKRNNTLNAFVDDTFNGRNDDKAEILDDTVDNIALPLRPRERRTRRVFLLFQPSVYTALEKEAKTYDTSVNEILHRLAKKHIQQQIGEKINDRPDNKFIK
jgi:hypothetical protein